VQKQKEKIGVSGEVVGGKPSACFSGPGVSQEGVIGAEKKKSQIEDTFDRLKTRTSAREPLLKGKEVQTSFNRLKALRICD